MKDVFTNLTMVNVSQYIHALKHHIVYLKLTQYVHYGSIELGKILPSNKRAQHSVAHPQTLSPLRGGPLLSIHGVGSCRVTIHGCLV